MRSGRAPAPFGKTIGKTVDICDIVVARLRGVDASDPKCGRVAIRVFIESILIEEFGVMLANDPSFHIMVEEIQSQMTAHPESLNLMEAAATMLISGKFVK